MAAHLWETKRRIEVEFRRELLCISRKIIHRVSGLSNASDIEKELLRIADSKAFQRFAETLAKKMVTGLFQDQGRTWRQAARFNGRGREVYLALKKELQGATGTRVRKLVNEVTYRIVTLPSDIGHDVVKHVAKEATKGKRASTIAEEIQKMFPSKTKASAKLIARTQVSMASTNLIRARCEDLGIDWYVWHATGGRGGDGRTRSSHRCMDGVFVRWNDPPAPEDLFPMLRKNGKPYKNKLGHYHAGQCPNCRCYVEPILDLDDVAFPARVYRAGRITMMKKKAFEKVMRK
jgi:hypothetical protein